MILFYCVLAWLFVAGMALEEYDATGEADVRWGWMMLLAPLILPIYFGSWFQDKHS